MSGLFLAQLLGLYFIIVGGIALIRRKSFMPVMSELVANKPLLVAFGVLEVVAGLAVVLSFPAITADWMGIIALIGWVMLIEGIIYLALPARKMQKFMRIFNTENWYLSGGVISVMVGAYLAGVGFGAF